MFRRKWRVEWELSGLPWSSWETRVWCNFPTCPASVTLLEILRAAFFSEPRWRGTHHHHHLHYISHAKAEKNGWMQTETRQGFHIMMREIWWLFKPFSNFIKKSPVTNCMTFGADVSNCPELKKAYSSPSNIVLLIINHWSPSFPTTTNHWSPSLPTTNHWSNYAPSYRKFQ